MDWVKKAVENKLSPPTKVVPGGAGELQFVWLVEQRRIEVDFAEPGQAEWMATAPGKQAFHYTEKLTGPMPVQAVTVAPTPLDLPANATAYCRTVAATA